MTLIGKAAGRCNVAYAVNAFVKQLLGLLDQPELHVAVRRASHRMAKRPTEMVVRQAALKANILAFSDSLYLLGVALGHRAAGIARSEETWPEFRRRYALAFSHPPASNSNIFQYKTTKATKEK